MPRLTRCSTLTATILATPALASDDLTVVYDNIPGGIGEVTNALLSEASRPIRWADDVTLGNETTVTAIQWSGLYSDGDFQPGLTDDFTITVYGNNEDGVNRPGAVLTTFNVGNNVARTDTGQDAAGTLDLFRYTAHIQFQMQADVTYWFSIANDHRAQGDTDDWFWGFGNIADASAASSSSFGTRLWVPRSGNAFDFRLLVPAPAPTGLLAFAALATARRRR